MIGLFAAASVASQVGLFFLSPAAHWRYQLLTAYAGIVVFCVAVPMLWSALRQYQRSSAIRGAARSK